MASRSLNRVVLLGNLTRDPELKYTPAGTAVCTFGLATNRSWTTSDGTTKEEAQYHRIVAWQKLAELCEKLLNKGKKVYVEGRITYREFTTKDGQQKNITEIVLDDFIVFHEGKRGENGKEDRSQTESSYSDAQEDSGYPEESYAQKKQQTDVSPEDIGI
jgi:single-strand DNA-binding protein